MRIFWWSANSMTILNHISIQSSGSVLATISPSLISLLQMKLCISIYSGECCGSSVQRSDSKRYSQYCIRLCKTGRGNGCRRFGRIGRWWQNWFHCASIWCSETCRVCSFGTSWRIANRIFLNNIEAKRQENSFNKIRIVFEEIESDLKSEREH